MSDAKTAQKLHAVLTKLDRLPDRVHDDRERLRTLELLQRRVVRIVADWPGIGEHVEHADELPAWERLCRRLETEHAELGRVDDIADARLPLVGQGRELHVAPATRATAWIDHAAAVVRLLIALAELNSDDGVDFRPARWFTANTDLDPDKLRHAVGPKRGSKRVRKRTVDGVVEYSAADARRWWPEQMATHTD